MGRIKGSKNKPKAPKPVEQFVNPQIVSSYFENELGKTLYDLVIELKPEKVIEFGTLNGYSAVCIGLALKQNKKGHLISYDLWDGYKFTHGNLAETWDTLCKYGVDAYVSLETGDFKNWTPESCDLLHVDISNDGTVIQELSSKMKGEDTVVVFEGGIRERDNSGWMLKYNKQPIQSCGVRYEVINEKFPSLSKLI